MCKKFHYLFVPTIISLIIFLIIPVAANTQLSNFSNILAETDSHTGSANFEVPIEVSSGRGGIQPNVVLPIIDKIKGILSTTFTHFIEPYVLGVKTAEAGGGIFFPGKPTLNSTLPTDSTVNLNWNQLTGVTGYKIKYGIISGSYTQVVDVGNVLNYTQSGLTNGTTYFFVITAYNGFGEGLNSNELTANPVASTVMPTVILTANPLTITEGESTTLNWNSTDADLCTASNGWTGTRMVSGTEILSPTVNATYALTCTGAGGSISQNISITVNPAPPVNQSPTVDAGANQTITLPSGATLSASASDDGLPSPPGAMMYQWIMQSGPGIVTFSNAAISNPMATFSANGTYVLQLTVNDGALSSSDVVTITVNPQPQPPSAPTLNTATAGDISVDLSWSSVADATGYYVKYGTTNGTYANILDVSNVVSTTIAGLMNGTPYYFIVTAYNANGESVGSNELSATPVDPTPVQPPVTFITNSANYGLTTFTLDSAGAAGTSASYSLDYSTLGEFVNGDVQSSTTYLRIGFLSTLNNFPTPSAPRLNTATLGDTIINLSWDFVAEASGYKVKYGTTSGVYGVPINVGNVTNYSVTGLTNGTQYYFVVTAYNTDKESGNSNELNLVLNVPPPGSPTAPTITLSINSQTIIEGGSATLTWSSTAANSCTASNGWSGTKSVSGSEVVSPTEDVTYVLTCSGVGGSAVQNIAITLIL